MAKTMNFYMTIILLLLKLNEFSYAGSIQQTLEGTVNQNESEPIQKQSRIVGGQDAVPGRYPSFVQWAVGCGGNLIYEDIILTAAHCYRPDGHVSDRVHIGSYQFNDGVQRKVIEFIPHQQHDVMILKIDSPVDITVPALNQDGNVPKTGDVLTVIGFGAISELGKGSSTLQEVDVDYVPFRRCRRSYGSWVNDDVNICAVSIGKDSCYGDSGGPLFDSNGNQVGVVSWATGCGRFTHPGVYARVSYAYPWIRNQICLFSSNPPSDCVSIIVRFLLLAEGNTQQISWEIRGGEDAAADDDDGNNYQNMYQSTLDVTSNHSSETFFRLMPGSYELKINSLGDGGLIEGGYSIWTGTELIEGTFGTVVFVKRFTIQGGENQASDLTFMETSDPTSFPTLSPTSSLTSNPTSISTTSPTPSLTLHPTSLPTSSPTDSLTTNPTFTSTTSPTPNPTLLPTSEPSFQPNPDLQLQGSISNPGNSEVDILVEIRFDLYPDEIGWSIEDNSDNALIRSVSPGYYPWYLYRYLDHPIQEIVTVNRGKSYRFTITDSEGDGLCCGFQSGYYIVSVEDEVVASGDSFGSVQYTDFHID